MIPRAARFLAAALAAGGAWLASAQQSAPPPQFAPSNLTDAGVRSAAAACAMCHGTAGRPVQGSSVAALAGRSADRLIDAMKQFKEGKREATIMHQIAKGYSDAEIAAIAAYLEKQAP